MSKKARLKRSIPTIAATWVAAIASVGLLLFSGNVLVSDFSSFRSCSSDTAAALTSCGKQGIDDSDVLMFILFVIAAILVVVLFSEAWRMSKADHGKK